MTTKSTHSGLAADVAPDGSNASDNLRRWFGKSSLVDAFGDPLVFLHGTGNMSSILEKGFSHEFTGQGNDQLGPGWYFTNKQATAQGYTTRRMGDGLLKPGGEEFPGVLDVFINLQNPIRTVEGINWFDQLTDLTASQSREMIRSAPGILEQSSPLSNWGEISKSNYERLLKQASECYEGPSHFTIFNDFYGKHPEVFLRTLAKVTGHDGVVHQFKGDEIHVVAWFPNQIKSKSLNNGFYDPDCSDITDAKSAKMFAFTSIKNRSATASAFVASAKGFRPNINP